MHQPEIDPAQRLRAQLAQIAEESAARQQEADEENAKALAALSIGTEDVLAKLRQTSEDVKKLPEFKEEDAPPTPGLRLKDINPF